MFSMAELSGPSASITTATAALWRRRPRWPRSRRRSAPGRLARTELDIRRLDERIDAILDLLSQICDNSGQLDEAQEFRELPGKPTPAEPVLRLVHGQH
jgi:hypothetical protein